MWKLSAVQRCGDVCTQRGQCHHGTSSRGDSSHPQHFTTGKVSFMLLFSTKSSFPEHQTPQTTYFFFELHTNNNIEIKCSTTLWHLL